MSEIKVNSIKGVGASAAAITVNNSDGTCTANLSNRQGKNLIINGAYTINQRGVTGNGSSGYKVVDRWTMSAGGLNNAMHQYQVDITAGDLPYTKGFRKMYRLTNDGQNADANDFIQAVQHIEAQNVATSGWNYVSSSSNITLSFYVRASVSQTYHGYLQTLDGTNKTNSFSFALTANTWTKVTKTFSGNSGITINNDNGAGLTVHFTPFMGTDFTASSVTDGAWQTYASGARTKDQTSTWMTTAYSTFEITGVQLEVGSFATDFEHRSFGQELALCQRYYETSYPYGVAIGGNDSYTGQIALSGSTNGSGTMVVSVSWNEKRTTPTVTAYNSVNGNSGSWYAHRNGSTSHTSVTVDQISTRRCRLYFGVGSNWVPSNAEGHFVANAEL